MVALTTDAWTSRATESYVTITSTHISKDWKLRNYVLQTSALPESHTGLNIAQVIKEAKEEWGLPVQLPIVTDNASNMTSAASEANCQPHIGCYAHTLNLASGKAFKVPQVSKLLAKIRRIVDYFRRSCLASAMLKEKQTMLNLPVNKLIVDVSTRWNRSVDMLQHFLEQQPAVYAALTSKDLRGRDKDLAILNEDDITRAEEFVSCLTPLKTATLALCEETIPTLSFLLLLHKQLVDGILLAKETDSAFIIAVKGAVRNDLATRYTKVMDDLTIATLLDPRFKSKPFMSEAEKLLAYQKLTVKAVEMFDRQFTPKDSQASSDTELTHVSSEPPLPDLPRYQMSVEETKEAGEPQIKKSRPEPNKVSGLSNLFGSVYSSVTAEKPKVKSPIDRAETEIKRYKSETSISLNDNPLDWWMENFSTYPILSHLAKIYLCIPGTSVPSERVFSTAGDIVTAQRAVLKPEHVDRIIFLKKNWS